MNEYKVVISVFADTAEEASEAAAQYLQDGNQPDSVELVAVARD